MKSNIFKSVFLSLICFIAMANQQSFAQPGKGLLGKGKELLGKGKGSTSDISSCESQVGKILDMIDEKYDEFKKSGVGVFNPFGVWFKRVALEEARFYLSAGTEGKKTMGAQCKPFVRATPQGIALDKRLKETEAKMKEMETARGVVFVTVASNSDIIYKNISTGEEMDGSASSKF